MKVILLDVSGLLYRAYYSLSAEKFSRSDGLPTNAIYGLMNIIKKIIKDFKGYDIIACCDSRKESNFRLNIDKTYKQNRKSTPENLKKQFEYIEELIQSMNINIIKQNGYEADDIISHICINSDFQEIIIVSSDKDMNQLVNDKVKIYESKKKHLIDKEYIKEKYKIYPNQFTFYQALLGDKIDNIEGIKGVGVKTAEKIVNQYENIEHFYNDINNKYINEFEKVKKNMKLVTLSNNIPNIVIQISKYDIDSSKYYDFCKDMEFTSVLKKLSTTKK